MIDRLAALPASPPLAQIPDAVTQQTASRLLDHGVLGLLALVLIGAVYFLARHLIECHKTNAAAAAAQASAMAEWRATGEKIADSMQEVARRLETIERALERQSRP
jgi:hypothetical protein